MIQEARQVAVVSEFDSASANVVQKCRQFDFDHLRVGIGRVLKKSTIDSRPCFTSRRNNCWQYLERLGRSRMIFGFQMYGKSKCHRQEQEQGNSEPNQSSLVRLWKSTQIIKLHVDPRKAWVYEKGWSQRVHYENDCVNTNQLERLNFIMIIGCDAQWLWQVTS